MVCAEVLNPIHPPRDEDVTFFLLPPSKQKSSKDFYKRGKLIWFEPLTTQHLRTLKGDISASPVKFCWLRGCCNGMAVCLAFFNGSDQLKCINQKEKINEMLQKLEQFFAIITFPSIVLLIITSSTLTGSLSQISGGDCRQIICSPWKVCFVILTK